MRSERKYGEWLWPTFFTIWVVLARLAVLDQPIVENYVGRQIPTAMVARNLERGSGFLFPQLDTGPFPSLFLVEPPIYQELVLLTSSITRLPLEQAGRAISALATGLSAASLFCLVRRRQALEVSCLTVLIFGTLPVVLRYGRSFQPDSLALGLVLAGTACWDSWRVRGGGQRADLAWGLVAVGLAVRVLWFFSLVPVAWLIQERLHSLAGTDHKRSSLTLALILGSMLVPAGLWYMHAANCLHAGAQPTAVNAIVWFDALTSGGILSLEGWQWIGRFGLVRAFSVLAVALAACGLWKGSQMQLWRLWALAGLATLALLGAKLHHEYYWLLVAPVVAVGAAEALSWLWMTKTSTTWRFLLGGVLLAQLGSCVYHARTTWFTPQEWTNIAQRSQKLAEFLPAQALVIGREAVIYSAERRGMRMEYAPLAIVRAFHEWGQHITPEEANPEKLISWYHNQGAQYYAEMSDPSGPIPTFPGIPSIVNRVLIQEPGLLLLQLTEPNHGNTDSKN